jgi:hypothetical protein
LIWQGVVSQNDVARFNARRNKFADDFRVGVVALDRNAPPAQAKMQNDIVNAPTFLVPARIYDHIIIVLAVANGVCLISPFAG